MLSKILNLLQDPNFDINIILHIVILFSFLSIFFKLYISNIEKNAFNDQIKNMIQNINPTIEKLKENDLIKNLINQIPNNVKDLYSNENENLTKYNNSIFHNILVTNSILWISLVIIILMSKSCNTNINIFQIIIENIATFSMIGLFEYWFFTHISFKYIPVEPSFIYKQTLESIKTNLNKL
jgi:hypothetical protein